MFKGILPIQYLLVITLLFSMPVERTFATDSLRLSDTSLICVEYLVPSDNDRDITTVNLDFNAMLSHIDKTDLSVYLSLTGTYATGHIRQFEGDINAGTFESVESESSAFGFGPGLLLKQVLLNNKSWALALLGSGHFMVYNEKFPEGGDYYNFMWRVGPAIEFHFEQSKSFGLSYQWAHISNGQGVSPQNPSYEAQGFAFRLTGLF